VAKPRSCVLIAPVTLLRQIPRRPSLLVIDVVVGGVGDGLVRPACFVLVGQSCPLEVASQERQPVRLTVLTAATGRELPGESARRSGD
jgi:hypothetical protein